MISSRPRTRLSNYRGSANKMKFGIVGNTNKPKVRQIIPKFVEHLQKINVEFVYAEDLCPFLNLDDCAKIAPLEKIGHLCDVVITFGGDGTLLYTASKVGITGVPILGVNIGALGFLTEIVLEDLNQTVQEILAKRYSILERMVLETLVEQKHETSTYFALNDIAVDKGRGARLITIEVCVDRVLLNRVRSDGVIVSTPTGSTAYSLSAGGPLMEPTMKAMIVTPICPHSLTVRPIVLADNRTIQIRLIAPETHAQINIDGQYRINITSQDRITIRKADHTVKWIFTGKRSFYEILRTKLNWGIDQSSIEQHN